MLDTIWISGATCAKFGLMTTNEKWKREAVLNSESFKEIVLTEPTISCTIVVHVPLIVLPEDISRMETLPSLLIALFKLVIVMVGLQSESKGIRLVLIDTVMVFKSQGNGELCQMFPSNSSLPTIITLPFIKLFVRAQSLQIVEVTEGTTPSSSFAGLETVKEKAQPHSSPRRGQPHAQHSSLADLPRLLNRRWALTFTIGFIRSSALSHHVPLDVALD